MGAVAKASEIEASARAIAEASATNQFVTFTCGNCAYGVEIMSVREIRSWQPTTPLPNQPHGAKGVLDIRGNIVQVYDLAALLGSHGGNDKSGQVVLVVSLGEREVGLAVDSVSDIIFARKEDMRPAPSNGGLSDATVSFLVKNEDRLIAILALRTLFPDYVHPLD